MPALSPCPSADRLRQLLDGALSDPEQADLVAHLDGCGACQRTLETLAGATPALLAAATSLQRTYADEPCLRRVLNEIEGDAVQTLVLAPGDPAAWLRPVLRPGASPDGLGRIDHYDVTEVLGQGSMGVVLKAFDPALKRWVAVKVLAPHLAGDEVARRRFAREAQAAAAVRHEHVITIHAVSEANGLPYLVMEYVAGGSLQDHLDRHGPPAWPAVARLGAQVASGLAAAHAHGLVHRDIKPSNILLEKGEAAADLGAAKIGDFGLARAADEARLTQTGIVTGTPMYMAPEQALCEPLDERADLFSLGSVLYTLCTGREPFPANGPLAVLRQVCEATPPPVREVNPAVPAWLAATVERLHAKRPGRRFASAAEVAELLRYNLANPGRERLPPPLPGERRRRPRRLVVGAVAAGLLLAGGVAAWEALHRAPPDGTAAESGLPLRATLRGHDVPLLAVAFAADGQTLATGSDDGSVGLWDAVTGQSKGVLQGHGSAVFTVAFAHRGRFLVSGGGDGTLRLWDIASRQQEALLSAGGTVRRVAIAPDDRTLAVGGSTADVELWDLASRQVRHTLSGHHSTIRALAFAPDGQTLATGDANGVIRFWDPGPGTERANFQGGARGLRALAFAPDSRRLASAGGDPDVKLWEVAGRDQEATLAEPEDAVLSLAFSPAGRLLATGRRDGTVKLWDVPARRALATLHAHQGSVWSVAFSPDGRTLATAGEDHLGKLWDLGGLAAGPASESAR
jgi:serine/threonine protein kinase